MNRDIIIFGKNSILAKNFILTLNNGEDNKIFISRKSNCTDDIVFNTSDLIKNEHLERICKKINDLSKSDNRILILFAWAGVPRTNNNKDNFYLNKNITLNFLNISEILKPKKIIFISSAGAVYSQKINKKFLESDQTDPSSSYGEQKLISELMINDFVKKNKVEHIILRVASAYGYDERFSDQGVINKWLYDAIYDKTLKLYNSEDSLINFIYFDQISHSIKTAIDKKIVGTFNIGSNKSNSLAQILLEIEKVINKKIKFKIINKETRYFNLDINKFYEKTGIIYENKISKNIDSIYKSIINKNIKI